MTPDQIQRQDADQLRILAIAFRIVGALCAICVNFAWIHVFIGIAAIMHPEMTSASVNGPNRTTTGSMPVGPAAGTAFGGMFIVAGLTIILFGFVLGIFGFRAAKAMDERRNWNLCFGTSIAFMVVQPIGLVLGILSLIVLSRPSVKQLFPPT